MKIANEQTFQQFDKIKQQLFAHKHKQYRQQTQNKSPVSPRFRILMPLTLIFGGLWLVYQKIPSIKQQLLKRQSITYQQCLFWQAFKMYAKCHWQQLWQNKPFKNNRLASKCYITKLESDYLYLTEKSLQKKLSIQTISKYSFWILGVSNHEIIRLVNQHGDLVQRTRQSKLMLGNLLRIWAKTQDQIIERDPIFGYYQKEMNKIGKDCEKINFINKMYGKKEDYTQILQQCTQQADQVRSKIIRYIKDRKKTQTSKNIRKKTTQ